MGKHGEYTVESINEPSPRAVIEAWLILLRHYPPPDSESAESHDQQQSRAQQSEDEQAQSRGSSTALAR